MRSAFHFEERQPRDERSSQQNRSTPRDDVAGHHQHQHQQFAGPPGPTGYGDYHQQYSNSNSPSSSGGKPSATPHRGHQRGYSAQFAQQYPPPHHGHSSSLTPRKLQSVVTSSFSIEDERDDLGRMSGRRMIGFASIDRRNDLAAEREEPLPSDTREDNSYYGIPEFDDGKPPSAPRGSNSNERGQIIQRSYSTGSKFQSSEPMKRSYYHHSRPADVQTGQLHPDFIPPKRMKVHQQPSPRGEVIMTPRSQQQGGGRNDGGMGPPREWVNRAPTWESEEDHYGSRFPRAQSFPPQQQQWSSKPQSPMGFRSDGHAKDFAPHISPGSDAEPPSPRNWHQQQPPTSPEWGSPPSSRGHQQPPYRFWDSPQNRQDGVDPRGPPPPMWDDSGMSHHHHQQQKNVVHHHYDNEPIAYRRQQQPMYPGSRPPVMEDKMQLVVDAAAAAADSSGIHHEMYASPVSRPQEPMLLLALPQDRVALSETLCVVREVSYRNSILIFL